jgi:hypothetical protein
MRMSPSTAEYVEDRVARMMQSHNKIHSNSELTEDQKIEEIAKMMTWHIGRTLSDQKSQLKFVMNKKLSDQNASMSNLVIDTFSMKLLRYKSMPNETPVNEEENA